MNRPDVGRAQAASSIIGIRVEFDDAIGAALGHQIGLKTTVGSSFDFSRTTNGGDNSSTAFAQTNPAISGGSAPAAQDDFVPILQEYSLLTCRQRDCRSLGRRDYATGFAVPSQLEQAAARIARWATDRAAGNQIPRLQVASVAGVVGEHLGQRPIHVAKISAAQPMGFDFGGSHLFGANEDFQIQIQAPQFGVRAMAQIR